MVHQVQARLSYLQGDAHWYSTLPLMSFIPYCPRILRSSSSSNLLQVPALTLFSVPAYSEQLLQIFGTLFLTHFVYLVHSTLSGSTSKHLYQAAFNTP